MTDPIFDLSDAGIRANIHEGGPDFVRQQLIEYIGHACLFAGESFPVPIVELRRLSWPLPHDVKVKALRFLDKHSDGVYWYFDIDESLMCARKEI